MLFVNLQIVKNTIIYTMREKIDCFLPYERTEAFDNMLQTLRQSKTVRHIFLLNGTDEGDVAGAPEDCTAISVDSLTSTQTMLRIEEHTDADYVLLSLKKMPADIGLHSLDRLLTVAVDSNAGLVYSDYKACKNGKTEPHPVIDYQSGSERDDFDFV